MSNACVVSATALPFRNTAFDVAILSQIIEHLHEPAQALAEVLRIARHIVVDLPREVALSNAIRRNVLRKPYTSIEAAGDVRFWSTRSIKRLLKRGRSLVMLENHVDLIGKEAQYFGKSRLGLAKPMFKQAPKALFPEAVYASVLTSHSTSLCKRAGR